MKKQLGFLQLIAFCALLILSVMPLWITTLLPFMDYPQFLGFVRTWQDIPNPTSPFHGTYVRGFSYAPTVLPLLILSGLSKFVSIEIAGKIIYSTYVVGLPLASLRLLRVLDKDPRLVFLFFPLTFSYWFNGGFFAFCTALPLLALGISEGIQWLAKPSERRGAVLALLLVAAFFWHALVFANLLQALLILWLFARVKTLKSRIILSLPVIPALGLFMVWTRTNVLQRPSGPVTIACTHKPAWVNTAEFFQNLGMLVAESYAHVMIVGLMLLLFFRFGSSGRIREFFHTDNPFGLLSLIAVAEAIFFPRDCVGVEGLGNRQCWIAAYFLIFALEPVKSQKLRSLALAVVISFDAIFLGHFVRLFKQFDAETIGASRLIDRILPGDTLLAPGDGATISFPVKPLINLELYATVRRGGLPNRSFAGYDVNFIRYANGKNPMPGLGKNWANRPELTRFDWVLLPSARVKSLPKRLSFVAGDHGWSLFAVCGSRKGPICP